MLDLLGEHKSKKDETRNAGAHTHHWLWECSQILDKILTANLKHILNSSIGWCNIYLKWPWPFWLSLMKKNVYCNAIARYKCNFYITVSLWSSLHSPSYVHTIHQFLFWMPLQPLLASISVLALTNHFPLWRVQCRDKWPLFSQTLATSFFLQSDWALLSSSWGWWDRYKGIGFLRLQLDDGKLLMPMQRKVLDRLPRLRRE